MGGAAFSSKSIAVEIVQLLPSPRQGAMFATLYTVAHAARIDYRLLAFLLSPGSSGPVFATHDICKHCAGMSKKPSRKIAISFGSIFFET